jgi:tRNA U34 5-carboxymethylaminomethyl modifying GTPase MnmE/TrmE
VYTIALNFTELDNKLAEIIMNNPFLSSKWDELGGKSIRILITGKTGTGKSALINGLVGQKIAVEGDTLDPQTSEVQQIKRMVQGVSMSIFDSPGLQDGTKREYEYMQDMQRKCRSVDLVLYAIRMTDQRVQAEDTTAMKKLTKAFGVEFWNRAIFVLTFANEIQDPVDPEDKIKTEAHFKKRLEVWKEFLPEIVEERTKIPAEIVRRIPIIPVGYYNIRDLPGQKLWFTKFWLAALNRMKEAGANGADYMLEFSKDRIKTSDQTADQDFEKPIYEQPIVFEE